jgi:hypothetical protein
MTENAQPPLPDDAVSRSASVNQLTVLVKDMEEVFRSVEPHPNNMKTFGHRIRNVLLLAAMEFENECKGLLSANTYTPAGKWSTVDFVKVLAPLRLDEFEVELPFYPEVPPRKPFQGWSPLAPTQNLGWYDAYNAVKHDREHEFRRATLETAIDALMACAIMLTAQYRIIRTWRDQIGEFFYFKSIPAWSPIQCYVYDPNPGVWQSVRFKF